MKNDRLIIINENDDLRDKLISDGVDFFNIKKEIKIISSKVHNNKIGYARLFCDDHFIKIIICPKIFKYDKNLFIKYLTEYELLRKKHPKIRSHHVGNTQQKIPTVLSKKQILEGGGRFDNLIDGRIHDSLISIQKFFTSLKSTEVSYVDHLSTTMVGKINIRKNVTEINQSLIHQSIPVETIYSELAGITCFSLDLFIRNRSNNRSLIFLAKKIRSFIVRKFRPSIKGYKVSSIVSYKVRKLFQGTKKESLYNHLLILIGLDDFFEKGNGLTDESVGENVNINDIESRCVNISSIFFESSNVFEYFVYDVLNEKYGSKNFSIEFHPPKEYKITTPENEDRLLNSIPDFLIEDKRSGLITVIDAKWKVQETIKSNFITDILKLVRDKSVHGASDSWVIYPYTDKKTIDKGLYTIHLNGGDVVQVLFIDIFKKTLDGRESTSSTEPPKIRNLLA